MRPYLAVLVDSFREALASRLLWVLLALITLVLIALAPFAFRETVTTGLSDREVRQWPDFIKQLQTEAVDESTPAAHIMTQLEEKPRTELREFKMPDDGDFDAAMQIGRRIRDIRLGLAKSLENDQFYDREKWRKTPIESEELKQLLDQPADQLSKQEIERRNRLLLEAAFPGHLDPSPPISVQLRYATWDIFDPLPLRQKDFNKRLDGVIGWLLKGFVGIIGLFVALVVTAPIVPQMFEPGSLHLLLSKPISRSLLFLTKFVGGCAFILVNSAYLIVGCWLILGTRFGIWNAKLLLAIPIYLFIFAVYYTVSVLTGVWWRNSILSIGMTVLFWLVCLVVGLSKDMVESLILNKQRLVHVVAAGDDLFGVNEMGLVQRWDADQKQWQETFTTDMQSQLRPAMFVMPALPPEMKPVGLVYDEPGERLLTIQRNFRSGEMATYVGLKSDAYRSAKGVSASLGAMALLREPDGRILCISSFGIYRLTGDPLANPKPVKLFGYALPVPSGSAYESVGPDPVVLLARPAAMAINPDTGELALYSRGKLTVLAKQDDGHFERKLEKTFAGDDEDGGVALGFAGNLLLVGHEHGQLVILDASNGEEQQRAQVEGDHSPRFVAAEPGGQRFAIVFHHGKMWLYEAATKTFRRAPVRGQGGIVSATFPAAGRLLVADRRTRVTEYATADWSVGDVESPSLSLAEVLHTYFLNPLYTIFPKPSELDRTIDYVLSGKTTTPRGRARQDLEAARPHIHPWTPVWSSGLFVIVALGLACFYLERQEF